jgi:hypothetical protein
MLLGASAEDSNAPADLHPQKRSYARGSGKKSSEVRKVFAELPDLRQPETEPEGRTALLAFRGS